MCSRSARRLPALLSALSFLAFGAAPTFGKAESGFAFSLGSAGATLENSATGEEVGTAEVVGGFDYQFAFSERFSVLVLAYEAAGTADIPELPDVSGFKVGTVGLEARLWFGAWFAGVHYGNYNAVVADESLSSFEISGGAGGQGITLGIEGDGGWFALLRTADVKELEIPDGPDVDFSSRQLVVGYRWK